MQLDLLARREVDPAVAVAAREIGERPGRVRAERPPGARPEQEMRLGGLRAHPQGLEAVALEGPERLAAGERGEVEGQPGPFAGDDVARGVAAAGPPGAALRPVRGERPREGRRESRPDGTSGAGPVTRMYPTPRTVRIMSRCAAPRTRRSCLTCTSTVRALPP